MSEPSWLLDPLLELLGALGEVQQSVALAGGLGLLLLHQERARSGSRTLLPLDVLPPARTTRDIDLMVSSVEVLVHDQAFERVKAALEHAGFQPRPDGRNCYWQWVRPTPDDPTGIIADVLCDALPPPTDAQRRRIKVDPGKDSRRASSRGVRGLHARRTEEAILTFDAPILLTRPGLTLQLPSPLSWLIMKLHAFRDAERKASSRPALLDQSRKHATDLYRLTGLLTEAEVERACAMARAALPTPQPLQEARQIALDAFSSRDRIGVLRLREHHEVRALTGLDDALTVFMATLPDLLGVEAR